MRRAMWLLLVTAVILGLGGLWRTRSGPAQAQPLRFNHAVHVKEAKCTKCHRTVTKEEQAGTPTTKNCASCHKGEQSKDPEDLKEEAKLTEYIDRDEEIAWVRLWVLPPHTFFSHQAHVLAKVECDACHGPIGKEAVLPASAPAPVRMKACVDCHARRNADNDCLACHR